MDPRGGWFQYSLLQNSSSDIEFETPPSPITLALLQDLPPSYEVASLHQAPSFNPAGTSVVDPFLTYHHPLSGDAPLPCASLISLAPSMATWGTTPSLTNSQAESSTSFGSLEPCLQASCAPTTVAQQPTREAKPPPKHHGCRYCSYLCRFPKDLKKHVFKHFPPTFKCPNNDKGCLRKFTRGDNGLRHAGTTCKYRLQHLGN